MLKLKTDNLRKFLIISSLGIGILFGACKGKATVSVNLHGIDYSGTEFSYYVVDPNDPEKLAGGEHIDPFSSGGTTCCAELPIRWMPGAQLKIRTTHWLPKQKPDEALPEVTEDHMVDVPRYMNGKPEELWVIREPGGRISLVSSDFQPDHPKWPGHIRGWPIPSLEYRRERWEIYRKHEEGYVKLYEDLLMELKQQPLGHAADSWEYAKLNDPNSLVKYTGSNDPEYIKSLSHEYGEGLNRSREQLKRIMESKP